MTQSEAQRIILEMRPPPDVSSIGAIIGTKGRVVITIHRMFPNVEDPSESIVLMTTGTVWVHEHTTELAVYEQVRDIYGAAHMHEFAEWAATRDNRRPLDPHGPREKAYWQRLDVERQAMYRGLSEGDEGEA